MPRAPRRAGAGGSGSGGAGPGRAASRRRCRGRCPPSGTARVSGPRRGLMGWHQLLQPHRGFVRSRFLLARPCRPPLGTRPAARGEPAAQPRSLPAPPVTTARQRLPLISSAPLPAELFRRLREPSPGHCAARAHVGLRDALGMWMDPAWTHLEWTQGPAIPLAGQGSWAAPALRTVSSWSGVSSDSQITSWLWVVQGASATARLGGPVLSPALGLQILTGCGLQPWSSRAA
ncbi:uncharacterized protein LOC120495743 [Passer montanus]|uniref:uncharacterized protein LOC120495743 n=1 Tax=Passer montanus TaxID=9160 RepID=UPI00195F879F|nr:uncharacterized protein LOC120495743 [Passer montanus]